MRKQNSSSLFKNQPTGKLFIYKAYIDKQDLALNNYQWLICHKTK